MGDLWGVYEKLDYIKSLDCDGIWFSPIYPSPGADCGYEMCIRDRCVRLRFKICVHADTDVCGITSHTINPFLLAIMVYAICTKKTILCTNI